jgi:ABC-2 type transport system permease protein
MRRLANIFWLGTKELQSFTHDIVLLAFMIYAFSFAIYAQSKSTSQEIRDASIAIVDEDRSALSRGIKSIFLPPYFKPPQDIAARDIDHLMDVAAYTFIIDIPPNFQRDVEAGHQPSVQVDVDATAAMQAGIGSGYIQQMVAAEIARFVGRADAVDAPLVDLAVRVKYNPNVTTSWFTSVMGIINNVTMLAIILAGAAIIREREHGTMDHLMVMPLSLFEIAMAKIWANGLVITVAVGLSLAVVVQGLLRIPIVGSIPLFMTGVTIYLFYATAIGIFIGTVARSMPQLGLLFMVVTLPINLLSGSNTPLESMPPLLQDIVQLSPTTHFVSFAESILYRGAGIGSHGGRVSRSGAAPIPQGRGGSDRLNRTRLRRGNGSLTEALRKSRRR